MAKVPAGVRVVEHGTCITGPAAAMLLADLARFHALVAEADVYIQNFRPGVADKISAGEARLRDLNPGLNYCAISGFGQDGPAAGRPSYDTVAHAASGFLKLLINPANPRVVGPPLLGEHNEALRNGWAPRETP